MPDLLNLPPPLSAIEAMSSLPRSAISPAVIGTQEGPAGHLGPESAGAILILQATFHTEEGAERFWEALVPLFGLLAEARGFIRRYGFGDGPSNTLIVLWQTVEDAKAFAATPQHREVVRNLYRERWQYTHFAALWEIDANHDRIAFCDRCEAVTPASRGTCSECGQPITDIYAPEDRKG